MNYNASLVSQFTFIILLATLTTLIPYAFSAAARADAASSRIATAFTDAAAGQGLDHRLARLRRTRMWTIAGSGYQVVFRGFMLLLAGIPVYVFMKWRARRRTRQLDASIVTERPSTCPPSRRRVRKPVTVG